MRGLHLGLTHFAFFPAVASGGVSVPKALRAPLADITVCATDGITQATAAEWVAISAGCLRRRELDGEGRRCGRCAIGCSCKAGNAQLKRGTGCPARMTTS